MGSRLKTACIAMVTLAAGSVGGYLMPKEPQNAIRLPLSEVLIERTPYVLAYDGRSRQARWVYEQLSSKDVVGDADRSQFQFREDPLVPVSMRSTKEDYVGSGFDRGHMCPAADAKSNPEAMRETFYLSNASPQCPHLNRGFWQKLENHVRDLALRYGSLHVYTGGLYMPKQESDGKKYVKYQVIGKNDVAVPTHYFKVVFDSKGAPLESYILPNEPITDKTALRDFMTSVDKVEKSAGIVFSRSTP